MDADRPIAEQHGGQIYHEVLSRLSDAARVRRYIEIGVSSGFCFNGIACDHGVAVDPCLGLDGAPAANKTRVSLFQLTSNEFFHLAKPRALLGGPADLVFLHRLHLFEVMLRDFLNAEAVCARQSIVALHNCLPPHAAMAERDPVRVAAATAGTPFAGWWTGDVWKLIPILRRYRPDLRLVLADAAPVGLVFVTDLDPSSRTLRRHYDAIVREFLAMPGDEEALAGLRSAEAVLPAAQALDALGGRRYRETRPSLLSRLFG